MGRTATAVARVLDAVAAVLGSPFDVGVRVRIVNQEQRHLDALAFGHALSTSLAPVSVRAGRGFEADYRQSSDGAQQVSRIVASPHDSRGRAARGSARTPSVIWNYQVSGIARVEQGGTGTTASAGDFWTFRLDRPYSLTFESDFEIIGTVLPTASRAESPGVAQRISARSDPGVAALGAIVDRLERELATLPTALQNRFIGHIRDAFDTVSRQLWFRPESSHGEKRLILQQALDLIDRDPVQADLTPPYLAATLHVSVRALHAGFNSAGMTVSSTIRARRLEGSRRDLGDVAHDELSVAEIGRSWGFGSPSHFAAAFHERYAVTPSEFRRASRRI